MVFDRNGAVCMSATPFNILEQLIRDKVATLCDSHSRAPRVQVRRRALVPSDFGAKLRGIDDQSGWSISLLRSEATEALDWSSRFKLNPLANRVERDVCELEFARYSSLPVNAHSQIVFSFSAPVRTPAGHLLYFVADRGFLSAQGGLCCYQGSFESPESYDSLYLWQS